MSKESEYEIVTEVGTFGNLNIDDPTVRKIKKKADGQDIDQLIRESIDANRRNLSDK